MSNVGNTWRIGRGFKLSNYISQTKTVSKWSFSLVVSILKCFVLYSQAWPVAWNIDGDDDNDSFLSLPFRRGVCVSELEREREKIKWKGREGRMEGTGGRERRWCVCERERVSAQAVRFMSVLC